MNILQIMAMVGQQNSAGMRIKPSIGDKTLPCFQPNDKRPEALGMVRSPYLKGMNPAEFFFSAMVGRDGLINTAINTAVTGYIQRRLVKALESSKTEWDGSVRDANGAIIQFKYGEDGFDGKMLEMNTVSMTNDLTKYIWGNEIEREMIREAQTILKNRQTVVTCYNVLRQVHRYSGWKIVSTPTEIWEITKEPLKRLYNKNKLLWAVVLQTMAAKRIANEFKLSVQDTKTLMKHFEDKYEYSLIPHGEMVGTLAAQSLGEPVTQMTLDTFHHSGNSAKNVTLGVPRFEELINASRNPRTPSCSIVLGKNFSAAEIDKAVDISFAIVHVTLRDLVLDSSIECIHFEKVHPMYCLLPDMPIKKKHKDGNWCVKIALDSDKLTKYQISFYSIIENLQQKINKGVNIIYTENPLGNSIVHIGYFGKKITEYLVSPSGIK